MGDEIARACAAKTGLQLLGHQDFHALARQHDPELGRKLESFFNDEGPGFFERLFFSTPVYQSLYEALVFELAAQGNVIIVGRGAQVVLAGVRAALKVRVVASLETRITHMGGAHGMTPDDALDFIRRHDHRREALVRQLYDQSPDDWKFFDLVINTDRLDVEAGVRLITDALEALERLEPNGDVPAELAAAALGKRVEAKLRAEVRASRGLRVVGQVGGTMVLQGSVSNESASQAAQELAAKQPGVTGVTNQLRHGVFAYGQ
jgi:hypothetical protein